MSAGTILTLVLFFGSLSIVALGGGNGIIPEIHLQAVTKSKWLTEREFVDLYAISQAAPGPSMLIVSLIGYKAAGWPGLAAATLAFFTPPAAITFTAGRLWDRYRASPWHAAAEKGLGALTVGLVFSAALIVSRAVDHTAGALVITGVTALLLTFTKVNPLLLMAAAGVAGWLGWA